VGRYVGVKVLIADDEKTLTTMLKEILRQNKIDCDVVGNGLEAVDYAAAGNGQYDLIVLDIMMPVMNGYEALKQIRQKKISTPVLMLSAKSEIADKVDGLNFGADDYLTKPFSVDELVARIKALTRRKSEYMPDLLSFGDITLDKNTFILNGGKQSSDRGIKLSNTEFKILEILIINEGHIISKDRLVEKVWGWDNDSVYNSAEVYISFLRKKLAAIKSAVSIKAIRGIGYCLEGVIYD
jgi:DNA-binding response OmpR family regulator